MSRLLAGAVAGMLVLSAAAGATARPASDPVPVTAWHPVTPAPEPVVTAPPRHQPDVRPKVERKATPEPRQRPRNGRSGQASWFRAPSGTAAAGPALRAMLGKGWRGQIVTVCATGGNCLSVRLTDWCACPNGRVIDLGADSFRRLAPLSRGLVRVTVSRE